jgi:hypothetical protein
MLIVTIFDDHLNSENQYICPDFKPNKMESLKFIVIGLFVVLLFLNLYFRIKVLKHYKHLVANQVQFEVNDIFDRGKIDEISKKYPQHVEHIHGFMFRIRKSVFIALVLIILIAIMGILLRNP